LINQSTNIVENIIIADPSVDPAPNGYLIIGLPEDSPVAIGWVYDPATGQFSEPIQN
jgi:hypothetical protein